MILSLKMALRSISTNKMRAILTILGIIIGVMALVVLVSLVNGATTSVTDTISGLGSNLLTVTIEDDKGKPVTTETLKEWVKSESDIGQIAPYISDSLTGRADGESGTFTVYGTTPEYYEIQSLQLEMGRWLKTADNSNSSYVCILNDSAAEEIIGYADCVGQAISLNGLSGPVTVTIGVSDGENVQILSGLNPGETCYYAYFDTYVKTNNKQTTVSFNLLGTEKNRSR